MFVIKAGPDVDRSTQGAGVTKPEAMGSVLGDKMHPHRGYRRFDPSA
jgi:hypothetical protein